MPIVRKARRFRLRQFVLDTLAGGEGFVGQVRRPGVIKRIPRNRARGPLDFDSSRVVSGNSTCPTKLFASSGSLPINERSRKRLSSVATGYRQGLFEKQLTSCPNESELHKKAKSRCAAVGPAPTPCCWRGGYF